LFTEICEKEIQLMQTNKNLEQQVKQKTAELSKENVELSKLNELKNEYLNMAAHDMRSPIAVIMGYADLLSKEMLGVVQDDQSYVLSKIKGKCKNILELINNLLDINLIESGVTKLNFDNVKDLEQILKDWHESNSLLTQEKSIKLHLEIGQNLPAVKMDKDRINQVVNNLISNAIKFSFPHTNITLSASNTEGFVRISVRDEGQGIAKDEINKLFEKYTKTSTRPTAGETSTGLGLAIVKTIVEAHGGELTVESQVSKGSVFSFTLPQVS